MHIPTDHQVAPRRSSRRRRARRADRLRPARPRPTWTTGSRRWPAWSPRSSSPCRCSTSRSSRRRQRPPARRRARRDAGRPVGRRALRGRGADRAGAGLRRRRRRRARPQHHQHGASAPRRRYLLIAAAAAGAAPHPGRPGGRPRSSPRWSACRGRVPGLRRPVLAGRHHRPRRQPGRPGRHDGRRAPADRHRRGPDHRDHRGHRRAGPPRPGVRAARAAARSHAGPAVRLPVGAGRDAQGIRGDTARSGRRALAWCRLGLLVALLLAGVVSNYASSHPDGLDSSLLKGCTATPTTRSPAAAARPSRPGPRAGRQPARRLRRPGRRQRLPLHRPVRGGSACC